MLRLSDPAPPTGRYHSPHCFEVSCFPRGARLLGEVVLIAATAVEVLLLRRLGVLGATSAAGMSLLVLAFLGPVLGAACVARFACLAATLRLARYERGARR